MSSNRVDLESSICIWRQVLYLFRFNENELTCSTPDCFSLYFPVPNANQNIPFFKFRSSDFSNHRSYSKNFIWTSYELILSRQKWIIFNHTYIPSFLIFNRALIKNSTLISNFWFFDWWHWILDLIRYPDFSWKEAYFFSGSCIYLPSIPCLMRRYNLETSLQQWLKLILIIPEFMLLVNLEWKLAMKKQR